MGDRLNRKLVSGFDKELCYESIKIKEWTPMGERYIKIFTIT